MTGPERGTPGTGSLAEEALRLIEAIGLLGDDERTAGHRHGSDGAPSERFSAAGCELLDGTSPEPSASSPPGQAGSPPSGPAAECRICPVCRLIAAVRQLNPEVLTHLAVAGEELLAAAREFAASRNAAGSATGSGPSSPSEPGPASGPASDPQRDQGGQPRRQQGARRGTPEAGDGPAQQPARPVRRPQRIELD